jgi:uncharacterized protein (TIGR02246 family)
MGKVILFIILLFIVSGCEQSERVLIVPKADVEADIQAIRDIVEKWEIAFNSSDTDKIMSFYSEDAVKIPPNKPAVIGKKAIRDGYKKIFEDYTFKEEQDITAIQVDGNLAYTNTSYSFLATPKTGGELSKTKGNWIRIFGKQDDETWKVIYLMQSDESLIYPSQIE